VDSLLEQLESVGRQQQPRPLDNPLLYGNYNVAYTSTSRAQGERGQRKEDSPSGTLRHTAQQQSRVVGLGMDEAQHPETAAMVAACLQLLVAGSGAALGAHCSGRQACISLCWSQTLPPTRCARTTPSRAAYSSDSSDSNPTYQSAGCLDAAGCTSANNNTCVQVNSCSSVYAVLLQVSFKLFGLLPGAVGLRGRVVPVPAGQPHGTEAAGERDTVRVLFEPPVLSLGDSLHFRIGGLGRCSCLPHMCAGTSVHADSACGMCTTVTGRYRQDCQCCSETGSNGLRPSPHPPQVRQAVCSCQHLTWMSECAWARAAGAACSSSHAAAQQTQQVSIGCWLRPPCGACAGCVCFVSRQ
jgi:hypothetical protein